MKLPIAPEMALSIARRESEFDPVVTSGVGARGLMQIMPDTAREVARGLGINNHSTDRLLLDWDYNAKLGSLATGVGLIIEFVCYCYDRCGSLFLRVKCGMLFPTALLMAP